MKYLNSYVQAPTTPPSPSNLALGTNDVAHRRRNRSGGYSRAVIISGVSFPNTLTYQTYNDGGNLAGDEILVRAQGATLWYRLPASSVSNGVATVPSNISTSWASVTPAELADNQDQFPITGLDFGTFSSASEPSQTVYLLNDGNQTINLLDLVVNAPDGATLAALDGRVRVDYEGVLGEIGVGNLDTASNGSLVYALGGRNSYPITAGPKGVIRLTLNLINFPATGLESSSLSAEFSFNPNRAGFALPTFLDWQDGGIAIGPLNPPELVTEDPDSLGVLVAPFTVNVGKVVYQSPLEQQVNPLVVGSGLFLCVLLVTSTGAPIVQDESLPRPTGSVTLGTLSYDSVSGEVTNWRLTAPPNSTRYYLAPNALLTVGRGVVPDSAGLLVHGANSLGVAVSEDGYFVPYGYALCEVGANVSVGSTLSSDSSGIYQPDPTGSVYAQTSGAQGDLVLCFLTPPAGSGGGGSGGDATNITVGRSSTTVTVESSTGADGTIPAATTSLAGVLTAADKTKLDGIATGASVSNLGATPAASTVTITNSGGTNATIPAATSDLAGVMTAADKAKLNGIQAGATVTNLGNNPGGSSIIITNSGGSNTTLVAATTELAGIMSAADKAKLNGIPAGGGTSTPTNLSVTRDATSVTVESSTGSNAELPAASTTLAGVLTGADKSKLNGIAAGAQVNVPTNLTFTRNASTLTVESSTGSNADLPVASTTLAGVMSAADKSFLTPSSTTLTLVNGWANFGFGFITAQAVKQGRLVSLAGVISGGTTTPGTLLSTIAVGFRPAGAMRFTVECSNGFVAITLETDGSIRIREASAGGLPGTFTSLAFTYFVN